VSDSVPPSTSDPEVMPPRWRVIVGTIGGVFLGLVLVVGLYAKALDPHAFTEVIEREGLDFLFSGRAVMFMGLGIEALLGFALLFGIRRPWILWPSAALVAFFLFLTGRHYYMHAHGLIADGEGCGCFGDLIERTPAEAFWTDLLLMVPALVLSFLGRPPARAPFPGKRMAVVGGLTLAALAFAAGADAPQPTLQVGAPITALCGGETEEGPLCLDAVIPELAEGDHVVLLVDLEDEAFLARLEELGDYSDEMRGPTLWVVSPVGDEAVETFAFTNQPRFELLAAPKVLIDRISPERPRSFRVRDGAVTMSWDGWPPFEDLVSEGAGSDDEAGGSGDTGSDDDGSDDD
jgi:hypothetical protein